MKNISVILVDDHPIVLKGLQRLFGQEPDIEVLGALQSVDEAFEQACELLPRVVVTDLNLGGDSGLRLVRLIRDGRLPTKSLVLSVYEDAVFSQRALDAGAHGYVNKTTKEEVIVSALRRVADGESVFSQDVLDSHRTALLQNMRPRGEPDEILSPREMEVFGHMGRGASAQHIAEEMFISATTVYKHIQNIKNKLLVTSSRHLAQVAVEWTIRMGQLAPLHKTETPEDH